MIKNNFVVFPTSINSIDLYSNKIN